MLTSLASLDVSEAATVFHNVAKLASAPGAEGVVFHALSARVPTDRCVAVLGRTRTGRTTLLRLLAGQLKPDAGIVLGRTKFSMLLNGKPYLDFRMTGIENIASLAQLYSLDPDRLISLTITLPGLRTQAWYTPVGYLEPRVRKSMEMLVAAMLPYECYLLDDIDQGDQNVVATLIRVARLRGAGVIFTTFGPRFARPHAECAFVLANQNLQFFETFAAAETFYGR